jgi:hypothetical protein
MGAGIGRQGGAGQVWPDNNVGYLTKRNAYNGESSAIDKDKIVSLKDTENGSAVKAFLAKGSSQPLWSGVWAIAKGGFGTTAGEKRGVVVSWSFVDLDTSGSTVDAPVYADEASPGGITLTPGAFTAQVGLVARVGASSTDTVNTVYLNPEAFRHRNGSKALIADIADAATFSTLILQKGSGGIVQLAIPAGAETRVIPVPAYMGQEITLMAISDAGGSVAVTITGAQTVNIAGNTTMTFADAQDIITLRAYPVAGATTLRWRVVYNDGVVLT